MEWVLAGTAIVCAGVMIAMASAYNAAMRYQNMIPEARSNIDVLKAKRVQLIAKLIRIVEQYGVHESGISQYVSNEFGAASHSGQGIVQRLASLRMQFPELKADALYDTLMQELSVVETELAKRREQHNAIVRSLNTLLSQFPQNLLLQPFDFQRQPYLNNDDLAAPDYSKGEV